MPPRPLVIGVKLEQMAPTVNEYSSQQAYVRWAGAKPNLKKVGRKLR